MTRVCVTWDREETARLVARCRETLDVCDLDREALEQAGAAGICAAHCDIAAEPPHCDWDECVYDARMVLNALPPRFLAGALNGVMPTVLDGIAATLGDGYQSRERDVEHALASLAAIAEALGVQEDGL